MGDGVDLGLIKRHNDTLHHLWVHVQLLQSLFYRTRSLAGVHEVAFHYCIFLMHNYQYKGFIPAS